jgi:O-acetyl-ADP-ribose deacetylase (regulator of RNase III)
LTRPGTTKLEFDAMTNAAKTQLRHGGGVAAAIACAGGPEVQRESNEKAPIGLGGRWKPQPATCRRAM